MTENNIYVQFINYHQKKVKKQTEQTELHHIIPLYSNGPNAKWNLIELSISEHQEAHQLLYFVYKNNEDLCALRFRQKNLQAYKDRAALSHNVQRLQKKGFFNSKTQSENGKRGGKVKSNKKIRGYRKKLNPEWKKILSTHRYWCYKKTGKVIKIKPFECNLPQDVTKKLLTYQLFEQTYKAKEQSLTSALTRVVKKQRKSASGWILMKK